MKPIGWKRLEDNELEASCDGFDFNVSQWKAGGYVLDIFDSKEKDHGRAHINSIEAMSEEHAKELAQEYLEGQQIP